VWLTYGGWRVISHFTANSSFLFSSFVVIYGYGFKVCACQGVCACVCQIYFKSQSKDLRGQDLSYKLVLLELVELVSFCC